jgi:SAM-dependent methyltransferase
MTAATLRCPACGGDDHTQAGRAATAFDSMVAGRTFHQPAYTIRCCRACGLYFKSHTLPLDQLDAYYAGLESTGFEVDGNFPTDNLLRGELERLADGSRVLDFGCSTGRILKGLTRRLECVGVEPNVDAAAIAAGRGIRIVSEPQVRDGGAGEFDAILLTDVYEHLPQPVALVEMLVSRLKPGGWLAIVTGNADAIRTRDSIGEYWYFRLIDHLQMLGESHVRWLAGRAGLEVQALHRCSHYDTPLSDRVRQRVRSFAYHQFRDAPRSAAAAVLRLVPGLNRAEQWATAPALMCGTDHVVAILRKPSTGKGR